MNMFYYVGLAGNRGMYNARFLALNTENLNIIRLYFLPMYRLWMYRLWP